VGFSSSAQGALQEAAVSKSLVLKRIKWHGMRWAEASWMKMELLGEKGGMATQRHERGGGGWAVGGQFGAVIWLCVNICHNLCPLLALWHVFDELRSAKESGLSNPFQTLFKPL
jgi:hypothetical protein